MTDTAIYAVPTKVTAATATAKDAKPATKSHLRRRVKALLGIRSIKDEVEFSVRGRKGSNKSLARQLSGVNTLARVFEAIVDAPGVYVVETNGKAVTFGFIAPSAVRNEKQDQTSSLMKAAMDTITLPQGAKKRAAKRKAPQPADEVRS